MNVYEAAIILGISASSNPADLKRTWRSMAKEWHPDRSSHSNAEEHFKRISEAFQIMANGGLEFMQNSQQQRRSVARKSVMISGPAPRRKTRTSPMYWEEQSWLEQEFGHLGYWSRKGTRK